MNLKRMTRERKHSIRRWIFCEKLSFDSCIDNDTNINSLDCPPSKRIEIPFAHIYIPQKSTYNSIRCFFLSSTSHGSKKSKEWVYGSNEMRSEQKKLCCPMNFQFHVLFILKDRQFNIVWKCTIARKPLSLSLSTCDRLNAENDFQLLSR